MSILLASIVILLSFLLRHLIPSSLIVNGCNHSHFLVKIASVQALLANSSNKSVYSALTVCFNSGI
ncbi:hypothetical protein CW304_29240 [Bacillus sp. UFRGS-B20]|nr:hypothetical protein CW304_29240 [Bacillus sp. UFRGS-B20]